MSPISISDLCRKLLRAAPRATNPHLLALLLVAGLPQLAPAAGSGLNVIVVLNQNSSNSVQLANEYCEARGVPPQNMLRINNWTGGAISWSRADFETRLRDPLLRLLNARTLTNQVEFVLLSMDIPYRITDSGSENSTTSALFYGFKTNTPPPPGLPASCCLPDLSSNSFAFAELPLQVGAPNTAPTNSFFAMMLTDTTLNGARAILARGLASDSTFPTQTVYLARTTDSARNVRYVEFDNALLDTRIRGDTSLLRVDGNSTSYTDAFGLLTGLATLSLPTNAFVPGGIGDSLTSYAGRLFENTGQTPLLAFLEAGAVASYGTVVEPCNYTEKFPDALVYFYQNRGFTAAESYYLSLLNPFQGLLVGEPLSAPFARIGGGAWSQLTNGTIIAGTVALTPVFYAARSDLLLNKADLFVDGTFFETLTNLIPNAGNLLSVTLNGSSVTYTIPPNSSLASVTAGLAAALNSQSNLTRVLAYPYGDRIELQSLVPSTPGALIPTEAFADEGSAPEMTIALTPARPAFLDTPAKGRLAIQVQNAPAIGTWLKLDFTKTNGTHVILAVTNSTSGATIGSLLQNLYGQINASPALQSADGVLASDFYAYSSLPAAEFLLTARSVGWPAAQLSVAFSSSADLDIYPSSTSRLEDNLTDLRPRNHLYLCTGRSTLSLQSTLDTTRLSDGFHELAVVAYEGTSVQTQTRITRRVQVQNTALSATLIASVNVTNVPLDTPLQFSVTANNPGIARIELFGNGGSLAFATNRASATFNILTSFLGLGLQPLYAVVTANNGEVFRTDTLWLRLVPSLSLRLTRQPLALSWSAVPGQNYDVLRTTNLNLPFSSLGSLRATNSLAQWPVVNDTAAAFYRLRLSP